MRNIGGNVGDSRLGEDRSGGRGFVSQVCVCVFAFSCFYPCVCSDIGVSYRAAVSL